MSPTTDALSRPPRVDKEREGYVLAMFRCEACRHVGMGRLDGPAPLICSACGSAGTAVRLAPKARGAA